MTAKRRPTRGPWKIDRGLTETLIITDDGRPPWALAIVCDSPFYGDKLEKYQRKLANARLLAASPDLLSACRAATRSVEEGSKVWIMLQDAIEKAAGSG